MDLNPKALSRQSTDRRRDDNWDGLDWTGVVDDEELEKGAEASVRAAEASAKTVEASGGGEAPKSGEERERAEDVEQRDEGVGLGKDVEEKSVGNGEGDVDRDESVQSEELSDSSESLVWHSS